MVYIFFAIYIAIALMNIISPQIMWRFNSRFYQNPQAMKPSKLGFTAQRIIGLTLLVFAVVLLATGKYHQ
jgi:hypothetical protein